MRTNKNITITNDEARLKMWLQTSHSERFHKLMRLWKINKMLANAAKKHVS